jgi:hypothetical protein
MKNLISMTDFVLEQYKTKSISSATFYSIVAYANFLKQPLELWMFVSCDDEGNILEIPDLNSMKYDINISEVETDTDYQLYDNDILEYQQAKERCLFDGWEYNSETEQLKKGRLFLFFSPNFCETYLDGNTEYLEFIEEIAKYDLELTATGQKQIGL